MNPLITLTSEEEIEKFLDQKTFWEPDYNTTFFRKIKSEYVPRMEDHYGQLKIQTRVICFLWDKKEYKEEYNSLKNDAKFLSTRENLRIGFVDNQKLIKKIKAKYSTKMFTNIAMSSLVLKRYDGELENYDLTGDDHVHIHVWINKRSLKPVDELNTESYAIYGLLRQPTFFLFVDFNDPKYSKQCYKAVEVLKEVAPKFMHLMGFFYVHNSQF